MHRPIDRLAACLGRRATPDARRAMSDPSADPAEDGAAGQFTAAR